MPPGYRLTANDYERSATCRFALLLCGGRARLPSRIIIRAAAEGIRKPASGIYPPMLGRCVPAGIVAAQHISSGTPGLSITDGWSLR